jgi:protein phosphatase
MFDYAMISERGPRPENEDTAGVWALSETKLAFAVADGVGGHIGGKLASELAVKIYRAALNDSVPLPLVNVARTIHAALKVEQQKTPQLRNMATTFSAVSQRYSRAITSSTPSARSWRARRRATARLV